jgi:hypothetical protein
MPFTLRLPRRLSMDDIRQPATLFRKTRTNIHLEEFCADLWRDELNYCTVLSIMHYKESDTIAHEYLVIRIAVGFRGSNRIIRRNIRIERSRSSSTSDVKDYAQLSSSSKLRANDSASFCDGESDSELVRLSSTASEIVRRLDVDPLHPLRLRKLINFVMLIPDLYRHYTVATYQCYWFCWVICHFLKEEHSGKVDVVEGPASARGGQAMKLSRAEKMTSYHLLMTQFNKNVPNEIFVDIERDTARQANEEKVQRLEEEIEALKLKISEAQVRKELDNSKLSKGPRL